MYWSEWYNSKIDMRITVIDGICCEPLNHLCSWHFWWYIPVINIVRFWCTVRGMLIRYRWRWWMRQQGGWRISGVFAEPTLLASDKGRVQKAAVFSDTFVCEGWLVGYVGSRVVREGNRQFILYKSTKLGDIVRQINDRSCSAILIIIFVVFRWCKRYRCCGFIF